MVKRELSGAAAPEIVTLKTPDDLPAARDLIARHGTGARVTDNSPHTSHDETDAGEASS
jgi:[acyl-carrier-protein] S-malonyltransferase